MAQNNAVKLARVSPVDFTVTPDSLAVTLFSSLLPALIFCDIFNIDNIRMVLLEGKLIGIKKLR